MLTDLNIRNAKLKTKRYKLKDTKGLFLRVNTKGTKTFFFRYKWLDKDLTINIGEYGQYTLTQAREKRDQFIDDLNAGINPKEDDAKAATFKELANQWLIAKQKDWSDKTTQTNKKRLKYALVDLGPKEIQTITPQDV